MAGNFEELSVLDRVYLVERNENARPVVAGVLSLIVRAWARHSWPVHKGFSLFCGSAVMCFGFGLCNLVCALDAYKMGGVLQQRHLRRTEYSWWLFLAVIPVKLVRWRGASSGVRAPRACLNDPVAGHWGQGPSAATQIAICSRKRS